MTLYQFNLLEDEEEKLAAILLNGECIGSRKQEGEEIFLYQVCSFYVEVASAGAKDKDVMNFRSFSSIDQLKPYLDQINILEVMIANLRNSTVRIYWCIS